MKLLPLKQFALGLGMALSLTACKKDDNVTVDLTVANLAGHYSLTALTQSTDVTAESSIYNDYIEVCHRDDLLELKTDNTVIYTDAGATCENSEIANFTWTLTDEEIAFISEDLSFLGGKVEAFDGTTLVLSHKENGVKIKATLVKQN